MVAMGVVAAALFTAAVPMAVYAGQLSGLASQPGLASLRDVVNALGASSVSFTCHLLHVLCMNIALSWHVNYNTCTIQVHV